MEVFRISKEIYSHSLNTSGVANRWNLRGQNVLYVSSSRSLATLEFVVHQSLVVPADLYKVMIIHISDEDRLMKQVQIKHLPENWRTLASYSKLQKIGSKWFMGQESLVLKVPSVVIPNEYNFVINAEHPDFEQNIKLIKTENYFWDTRILTKQ